MYIITYADDAIRPNQLDEAIRDASLTIALAIGLEIAQVANVAVLVGWGTVALVMRVDWPMISMTLSSSYQDMYLTVRSSRGTAVGVVTEGVHMHTTLSVGVVAGDVPCDGGWVRL